MSAIDHRGLGKRIKRRVSPRMFRLLTVMYNTAARFVPSELLYAVAGTLRRRKYPYSTIQDGDIVVQVGAPRDLLAAGRSRAAHFLRLVGSGKVVIIEPDPDSFAALEAFIKKRGLERRAVLIRGGVWTEPGEKVFLSSERHPAANLLADAKDISDDVMRERGYRAFPVQVDTLDNLLRQRQISRPKLVSITVNGAELGVVGGMKGLIEEGLPYVSLASTGEGYVEHMRKIGYDYLGRDDRGYMFGLGVTTTDNELQGAIA